jgi:hypothetical protein
MINSHRNPAWAAIVVIVAALAGGVSLSLAQNGRPTAAKPPGPAASPALQSTSEPTPAATQPAHDLEAALAAMTPGPIHRRLMRLAGEWTVATKLEMPGQPASDTVGKATLAAALGGRFLHETGDGEMMGAPTHHFKQWGYNNGSKKYEAVWSWTMSTGLLSMSGESPDDGKTILWIASYDNEVGVRQEFKCKTTLADDDHFTVVIDGGTMPDGTAGPTMAMTYTRVK